MSNIPKIMSNIPKIIHQTAPADKTRWHPIWEKCQNSWKHYFPEWEYRFWTDEDLDTFIKTKYAWFYPIYVSYPKQIQRVDSARYFILNEYGGLYADMDFECIQNFEHIFTENKVYIAESEYKNIKHEPDFEYEILQNALMASPPKHEFWIYIFEDLLTYIEPDLFNPNYILNSTGPQVIIRTYLKYSELVHKLSSKTFSVREYKPETMAVHHGTKIWSDNYNN
jgi:mannosyltransferase OCH1-like enzyme